MSTTNTSNEPSEIDKKKGDAEKPADWAAFGKEFGIKVLVITILITTIFLGSVAIFTEKVASLELLPTDISKFPFEPELMPEFTGNIGPIDINIENKYDSIFSFTPIETTSTKIYFDMDEINESYKKEGFINLLNSLKYDSNRVSKLGGFGLYFRDVMCTMIGWNNSVVNGLYGFTNKYLPDWLILVLWPFISTMIYGFTMMVNYFACIVSHIINLKDWVAQVDESTLSPEGRVNWLPDGGIDIRRIVEMVIYGFFGFFFVFTLAPIIITIYSVLSPSTIQAKFEKNNKPMEFLNFIKDTVKTNMNTIMLVLSYNLLVITKNTLGSTYASSALLAIIIAAFGLHLYNRSTSSDTSNTNNTNNKPVTPNIKKSTPITPVINPVSKATTLEKSMTPNMVPNVSPSRVTNAATNVSTNVTPNMVPNVSTNMTPNVSTNRVTNVVPSRVTNVTQPVDKLTPNMTPNRVTNIQAQQGGKKSKK
jgi:hypothetical protein